MGKYVLLLTLAAVLGFSYFAQRSQQTAQATSENQAERQETVLARQIARSAFNRGISEAKRGIGDPLLAQSQEAVEYEKGEFDLTYSNLTTEIKDLIHWKRIDVTATGRFPVDSPQKTYRISATARQAIKEEVNALTAAESVDFHVNGPGCKNQTCIDGTDAGGGKNRHGVSLPPEGDGQAVCDAFEHGTSGSSNNGNGNNGNGGGSGSAIAGKGSGCSVKTRTEDRDEEVNRVMEAIQHLLDSEDSDKIQVYDEGAEGGPDEYPTEDDPGILYVKDAGGKESGKGVKLSDDWHGLVFVAEGEQITVNGQHGIKGGLLLEKNAKFRLNGGGSGDNVVYNTSRLLDLVDVLPMLGEPVQITDRAGTLVSASE